MSKDLKACAQPQAHPARCGCEQSGTEQVSSAWLAQLRSEYRQYAEVCRELVADKEALRAELAALKAGQVEAVGVFKGAFGTDANGRLWFKARALGAIPAVGARLYTAPPATDEVSVPRAHADVLAERRRQVEAEGFDVGHDDMATRGQLSRAAGLYALHAHDPLNLMLQYAPPQWPWDESWWKPSEPRRMLVKSAALVLAEIERIDRGLLEQMKS